MSATYYERDLQKFKQLQREFESIRAEERRKAMDRFWKSDYSTLPQESRSSSSN